MERPRKRKRVVILLLSLAAVLTALLVVLGVYLYRVLKRPASFFDTASLQTPAVTAFPLPSSALVLPTLDATQAPTAAPTTPSPILQRNVVNIALIGIDAYEDGATSSGTMPHADVCMIIAIDFDANTVDLISLPRDLFTSVPGYAGYYKLNGAFNVGGGLDDPSEGFLTVCRTAELWLGGVSVPYYYGVDFAAVVKIVDAIGGVDYTLDVSFHSHTGVPLRRGASVHLDGTDVLTYLRLRTTIDGKDSNRTARQRKMLVTIFSQLKEHGELSMLPDLIGAVDSGVYTNTDLSQTVSLVHYAATLGEDTICTRAMFGEIHGFYDWAFCFVDDANRHALLEEVYGIDAAPLGFCTVPYERWLHRNGFAALKTAATSKALLETVHEKLQATEATDAQQAAYATFYTAYAAHLTALSDADAAYRSGADNAQKDACLTVLREKQAALQKAAGSLAALFGNLRLDFSPAKAWETDPDLNEVYVDFR